MDRRFFLKLTGFVAAASALDVRAVLAAPEPTLHAPGVYQFTGRVRLDESLVEISGITNAQTISWSRDLAAPAPMASFTSFESFDQPWQMPRVNVRGGRLEALAVVPIDLG